MIAESLPYTVQTLALTKGFSQRLEVDTIHDAITPNANGSFASSYLYLF